MSTVAFFSAKGAPGATTAAMLVASLWPRPALLVDSDGAGGDIGLRLPSPEAHPLDLSKGMLSLLPLARRDLAPGQVLAHAQQVLGGGEVIVGVAGPEQASAAGPVWPALANAFAEFSTHDVMIDLGRLEPTSAVLPMAGRADIAVLVLRDSLPGVFAARARLRALAPALTDIDGSGPVLGLIVQSASDRDAESAASVIQEEFARVQYFGRLALDVGGVRMFDGEHVARPERTMIVRSGREVVAALDGALYASELMKTAAPESRPSAESAAEAPVDGKRRSRADERAARKGRLGRRNEQGAR